MNTMSKIIINGIEFPVELVKQYFPFSPITDFDDLSGFEFDFSNPVIDEYLPLAKEFIDYIQHGTELVSDGEKMRDALRFFGAEEHIISKVQSNVERIDESMAFMQIQE